MIRRIGHWLPTFLWAAFIFYLSSQPGLKVSEGFWDVATRKPAHIFVYFILYLLVTRALLKDLLITKKKLIIKSFILTIVYGAFDEFHQSFVPLREGKVLDIMWDGMGAALAAFVLWSFYQNPRHKLKNWLVGWFLG